MYAIKYKSLFTTAGSIGYLATSSSHISFVSESNAFQNNFSNLLSLSKRTFAEAFLNHENTKSSQ
jgi:hypothetical protein